MLQYSHSSELFAVLFVYIDKEQLDKLEFDKGVCLHDLVIFSCYDFLCTHSLFYLWRV